MNGYSERLEQKIDQGIDFYKKRNHQKALLLFNQAANEQYPRAWFWLAKMYNKGKGVVKSNNEVKCLFELIKNSAEKSNAVAMQALSDMYKYGYGTEKNNEEAFIWCEKSANMEYVLAQRNLGQMYFDKLDYKNAFLYFQKAAQQEDPEATGEAGWMYYEGRGIDRDDYMAVSCWKKAAKMGNTLAQYAIDWIFEQGKDYNKILENQIDMGIEFYDRSDYDKAYEIFSEVAKDQYPRAWGWLAKLYHEGKGVKNDEAEENRMFQLTTSLAEKKNIIAIYVLGSMYRDGYGTHRDDEKAFEYFYASATEGYARAKYYLSLMYKEGRGTQKNPNEAQIWLKMAATQGDPYAQSDLSFFDKENSKNWLLKSISRGVGVSNFADMLSEKFNYKEAFRYYQWAAAKGCSYSQCYLGMFYQFGFGVMCNYEKAYDWYECASAQGNQTASHNLGVMYFRESGISKTPTNATQNAYYWFSKASEQGCKTSKSDASTIHSNRFDIGANNAENRGERLIDQDEYTFDETYVLQREKPPGFSSFMVRERRGSYHSRYMNERTRSYFSFFFDYTIPHKEGNFFDSIKEALMSYRSSILWPFVEKSNYLNPFSSTPLFAERSKQFGFFWENDEWPNTQRWIIMFENGQKCKDFYWVKDKRRGWPEKNGDNYYYWFIVYGPNNLKIEGLRQVLRSCDFPGLTRSCYCYHVNYVPTKEVLEFTEKRRKESYLEFRNEAELNHNRSRLMLRRALEFKSNIKTIKSKLNAYSDFENEGIISINSNARYGCSEQNIHEIINNFKNNPDNIDRILFDFFNLNAYQKLLSVSKSAYRLDDFVAQLTDWEETTSMFDSKFMFFLEGYFPEVMCDLRYLRDNLNKEFSRLVDNQSSSCIDVALKELTNLQNHQFELFSKLSLPTLQQYLNFLSSLQAKIKMLIMRYQNELQKLETEKHGWMYQINQILSEKKQLSDNYFMDVKSKKKDIKASERAAIKDFITNEESNNEVSSIKKSIENITATYYENYDLCTKKHISFLKTYSKAVKLYRELHPILMFYEKYIILLEDLISEIDNVMSRLSNDCALDETDNIIIDETPEKHVQTPVKFTVKPSIALTQLVLAIESGKTEKVRRVLAQVKPDVNTLIGEEYKYKMWTPLHLAATKENVNIIHLLMTQDPKLEIRDMDGNTPLLLSMQHGRTKIAETLLDYGANKEAYNDDEKSANDLAIESGNEQLMRLFSANEDNDAMITETNLPEGEIIAEPENKRRKLK